MDSINKLIKNLSASMGSSEKFLNNLLGGPYVYGAIVLIIGMYGPRLSPRLPTPVRDLFNNAYFRFVVLTMVVYLSNKNLYLAMTVSIAFVLLLNLANSLEVEEHFVKKYAENFSEFGTVLTEGFEDGTEKVATAAKTDEKPKQVAAVAAVEAPAPAAPKETGDNFGDASYRQGYTDGQEAQCPISSTGGLAYAVVAKVEDKTE
tara:strand:- start:98 stop:709 length:612 start_codon:yes stop_codon:yes gene_type:complete